MTARPAAALFFAALPVLAAHAQTALPALPGARLPGIDQVRVAIPDAAIAGHPFAVYEVRSLLPPRMALGEVERFWRAQGAEVVLQARSGDWFVLSQRLSDDAPVGGTVAGSGPASSWPASPGFETLQLRARHGGGSTGLLTRWFGREPAAGRDEDAERPAGALAHLLPDGAQPRRSLSSNDSGHQRGQTVVAELDGSLERAAERFDRHLRRLGFVPMKRPDDPQAMRWPDDRALFYRRTGSELLLTLHRQAHGVGAVLHLMENR